MQPTRTAINIALLILISIFFTPNSHAGDPEESVRNFSETVRKIIASSDRASFSKIPCVPIACSDSPETLDIIFGGEEVSAFERIMRNPNITIWIYGPFTLEEHWANQSYMVVFYDPANSPFDESGFIPDEVGLDELYKSFLQVIVTISEGEVKFHRVPFHLRSHHPYAGDYG